MLREPQRFGKYLLLERISVGGMAEVFKAKAFGVEGFEKILAIKRILPNMVDDSDFIEMFIDEAKIAGQLNHADICQIFELGRYEKAHYIAMEYISGKDLLQITNHFQRQRQTVPVGVACFVVSKLCEGLDYAHRKRDTAGNPLNIIHRDVSPQNVLVSYEGEVKLIDFGIAKARYRSSKTAAGVLKGKFGYMSPEQVRGLRLDRRTDIFSLGTLLYEMVTGCRLFGGDTDFAVLEKVRNVDITPPSRLSPAVTPAMEQVIMRALAKTPEGRYQWANELQEDLQGIMLQHEPLVTTKRLSAFMKQHFAEDIQRERSEHERYLAMGAEYGGAEAAPPPPPSPSRGLPDFDAYDDDEETALMKQQAAAQSDFPEESTLAQTPNARAHMAAVMSQLPEGESESTVILWGQDDEEEGDGATMILADDGAGLPPSAALLLQAQATPDDDEAPPEGATMILQDGEPPEGATMILQDGEPPEGATMILQDGEPPEGATMILPDGDGGVVDGIPLDQVRRDAAAANARGAAPIPGPALVLPADLPKPRPDDDPFGLRLPGAAAPAPAVADAPVLTTDTARTRKPVEPESAAAGGGRKGLLRLVAVGLGAALLGGLLVGLLKGGTPEAPPKAPPPPTAVALLVRADADVAVVLDGKQKLQTGSKGAVLLQGLAPGKHEVALSAKGYHPQKATFTVEAGQIQLVGPVVLKAHVRPAILVINVSEMFRDAEVTLDGQLVPMAKLGKPMDVPANKTVLLRVGMLGYEDYVERIQTRPGARQETKSIALVEAELGQVAVRTAPIGATVYVNGVRQPLVTPCRVQKLNPKKKFKLKLELSGYKVHEKTYSFPKTERIRTIIVSLSQVAEAGTQGGAGRSVNALARQ